MGRSDFSTPPKRIELQTLHVQNANVNELLKELSIKGVVEPSSVGLQTNSEVEKVFVCLEDECEQLLLA